MDDQTPPKIKHKTEQNELTILLLFSRNRTTPAGPGLTRGRSEKKCLLHRYQQLKQVNVRWECRKGQAEPDGPDVRSGFGLDPRYRGARRESSSRGIGSRQPEKKKRRKRKKRGENELWGRAAFAYTYIPENVGTYHLPT